MDDLLNSSEDKYGSSYKDHCLEIYKIYIEMADRISARRQSANSFFLSINTAAVAFVGYVLLKSDSQLSYIFYWLISIAGMVICYQWYRLIRSYKDINSGKFQVIHEMEKKLPFSPYDAEWTALGRGEDPKLYLQFTGIEMRIPWIFFAIHLFILLWTIPWCN